MTRVVRRWSGRMVAVVALALALVGCDSDGDGGGALDVVGDVAGDTIADTVADAAPVEDVAPADVPAPEDGVSDAPSPEDVAADVPGPEDVAADVPAPEDTPAPEDVATDVPAPEDTAADTTTDTAEPGPYGFTIRVPQTRTLECEDFMGEPVDQDFPDTDHVCTFEHDGTSAVVYVQATPVECVSLGMSNGPVFDIPGAWISIDGDVSPLSDVVYDWGGNHQNNALDFVWNGTHYRYWHSSFGFGWRVCQPMDCLQVLDAGEQIVEDGCCDAENPRALPVVCVQVQDDGTVPDLVDTYAECNGHDDFLCY